MRKRKGNPAVSRRMKKKQEIPENHNRTDEVEGDDDDEAVRSREEDEEEQGGGNAKGGRFFACYLLTSLSPRHKGHTYIGFTVNPRRRIRQHNGEIRCGAWRTKGKRPWEMVLCIYGFPTNVAALQFEWAWQHPIESLAVRKAAAAFKSLSGLANKIKLVYTMLTLPAWESLKLTVNFFSTKYKLHTAGCPCLPAQIKVQICSMDELPCYTRNDWNVFENSECGDDVDHIESVEEASERCADNVDGMFPNFSNHPTIIEESTSEHKESIERSEMRQQNEPSPSERGYMVEPFCCSISPRKRALSSLSPSLYNTGKMLEDRSSESQMTNAYFDETSRCSSTTVVVDDDEPEVVEVHNYEPVTVIHQDGPETVVGHEAATLVAHKDDNEKVVHEDEPVTADRSVVHEGEAVTADQILIHEDELMTVDTGEDEFAIKSLNYPEVEVVDLFTPSPYYSKSSHSKKREALSSLPQMIDLTNSPIYV